jgi:hypothetical protein
VLNLSSISATEWAAEELAPGRILPEGPASHNAEETQQRDEKRSCNSGVTQAHNLPHSKDMCILLRDKFITMYIGIFTFVIRRLDDWILK